MKASNVLTLALALALPAMAALADPAMQADSSKGKILVDSKGMSLYTFDNDSAGMSACNGPCAKAWPPLMASASDKASGKWSVVKRDDGSMQWAYDGKPLYGWVKDTKPGDVTGDGFKGVWHLATPGM